MDEKITSPLKAIRAKCLDCCYDDKKEIKLCPVEGCALWPFRLGKNPFRKRTLTDEQRQAISERFKKLKNNEKEITEDEQEEY